MEEELRVSKVEDRHTLWVRLAPKAKYDPKRLAKRVGISLRQLQRYFQEDFGRTPSDWLREKRAVDARILLKEKLSLKRVSHNLGYQHQSQFTRDFKASYGMTPKEFRKQHVDPHSVEKKLGLKGDAFVMPEELR